METVQTDVQQFNQLHPHRKLAIFSIILFVFVVSVAVGVYYSKRTEDSKKVTTESEVNPTASTILSLIASEEVVKVGDTFTVTVLLSGKPAQAADIAVAFDSSMFAASNIVNGKVYNSLFRQNIADGMVTVSGNVEPVAQPEMKTGELVTFTLKALKKGTSEVSIDRAKTVTAVNGADTLSKVENITIEVR